LKKLLLTFGNPICCPSVTYNMETLKDFKFSENYQCALDWYAWYELAQREGAFTYIDKKLVKHRIHIDSETTLQISSGQRRQEELQIFELMWGKKMARFLTNLYAAGYKNNISVK
jgi:hypothetical protein